AIGCAVAGPHNKVIALVGDGGLALGLGELATLAQEQLNITLLVMNDQGYGVMRGIQDKYFGGRHYYNQLHTPDFMQLAQSMGLKAWRIEEATEFKSTLTEAVEYQGPSLVVVEMDKIGAITFAGPPQKLY
ncbi:MAG: thiamine pyrophosphate-dependent enzyme, partial [Enterobacteriaceae bacterium]